MAASPHEIDALGRAAGEIADRLATTPVQTLHAAIADRVFKAIGPAGLPVRVVHDGIATAVYAGVRMGVHGGARAAAAAKRLQNTDPEAVSRHPRGALVMGIANGLIGHELADRNDPLAIRLRWWQDGRPVPPAPETLRQALPDATGSLAVFVHGLFETERSWTAGTGEPYSGLLREQGGWTPLHLRYNTGLPIAENGRKLSLLLEETAANWPVDLERIALIGHSMGGIVARSAGRTGTTDGAAWREKLTHVACLGTPHRGSPVAQAVHAAAEALAKVPEGSAISGILEQRSAGIRDLRNGIDAGPLLDDVHHLFVTATLTVDPAHPLGGLVGDLLVRSASAAGPAGCEVRTEDVVHLHGLSHVALLHHPEVYGHLRDFLRRPQARAAPSQPDGGRSS